jgi:hypothetical protein
LTNRRALDEANVDRFGRMLQEFANISQFIVITHNKRLLQTPTLCTHYNGSRGVSKIVSVKFSKEKKPSPFPRLRRKARCRRYSVSQQVTFLPLCFARRGSIG